MQCDEKKILLRHESEEKLDILFDIGLCHLAGYFKQPYLQRKRHTVTEQQLTLVVIGSQQLTLVVIGLQQLTLGSHRI